MSKIILSHPYSGALYRYFSDQLGHQVRDTLETHPYYRTLHGDNPNKYVDLALLFLLLYDDVLIAPADNFWPKSRIYPNQSKHIIELGLYADWDDFHTKPYLEHSKYIEYFCEQPILQNLLKNILLIPRNKWRQIVEYALYEASLSARKRIPILCSVGRRQLISTLVQIQSPALHPLFSEGSEVKFVTHYRNITSLSLAPKTLDHLMDAKLDADVRKYGNAFITAATNVLDTDQVTTQTVAKAALEAIETKKVSELFAGRLNWAASFLRLIQQPMFAGGAAAGSYLASAGADSAGWYEFKGSIDRAIDRSELITQLDAIANPKNL